MFGLNYGVRCPHCGKRYVADHGITPIYTVKGKEHIGNYCLEDCIHCGKPFLSLCEAKATNIQSSDIILKFEDYKDGDIVSSGCTCF